MARRSTELICIGCIKGHRDEKIYGQCNPYLTTSLLIYEIIIPTKCSKNINFRYVIVNVRNVYSIY